MIPLFWINEEILDNSALLLMSRLGMVWGGGAQLGL